MNVFDEGRELIYIAIQIGCDGIFLQLHILQFYEVRGNSRSMQVVHFEGGGITRCDFIDILLLFESYGKRHLLSIDSDGDAEVVLTAGSLSYSSRIRPHHFLQVNTCAERIETGILEADGFNLDGVDVRLSRLTYDEDAIFAIRILDELHYAVFLQVHKASQHDIARAA